MRFRNWMDVDKKCSLENQVLLIDKTLVRPLFIVYLFRLDSSLNLCQKYPRLLRIDGIN